MMLKQIYIVLEFEHKILNLATLKKSMIRSGFHGLHDLDTDRSNLRCDHWKYIITNPRAQDEEWNFNITFLWNVGCRFNPGQLCCVGASEAAALWPWPMTRVGNANVDFQNLSETQCSGLETVNRKILGN